MKDRCNITRILRMKNLASDYSELETSTQFSTRLVSPLPQELNSRRVIYLCTELLFLGGVFLFCFFERHSAQHTTPTLRTSLRGPQSQNMRHVHPSHAQTAHLIPSVHKSEVHPGSASTTCSQSPKHRRRSMYKSNVKTLRRK